MRWSTPSKLLDAFSASQAASALNHPNICGSTKLASSFMASAEGVQLSGDRYRIGALTSQENL